MNLSASSMGPLVSESLTSKAFERLESAITTGELEPGSKISEADLAKRFQISRGPLREAIARLEGRRLVERVPNVGARVAVLSSADLLDLYAIREALEGMACRLAASQMKKGDIQKLSQLLNTHSKEPKIKSDVAYYQSKGEQDFHFFIANCSRNDWLINILCNDLYSVLRLYRFKFSASPGRPQQALHEHHTIVDALSTGDPDRAEEAMRKHIRNSLENLKLRLNLPGQEGPGDSLIRNGAG